MRRGMKVLAILALIAAAGATTGVFANCVGEGPYEVRQCSKGAWFGIKPATAGPHTAVMWGIGFGNNNLNNGGVDEVAGNGFLPTPLPGRFIGVDNGIRVTDADLDLADASTRGLGAPAGTLCFDASANWGSPGLDSCIDINRNDLNGNGATAASDNIVNKYWDGQPCDPALYDCTGTNYLYLNHQLDPPMGVLLTEANGQWFAAAFFASTPKQQPRQSDPDPGQYSMGELINGDPSPFGGNTLVPWQPVPRPQVTATIVDPLNPDSPRSLALDWSQSLPRFLHDNSTRPCLQADNTTPCASMGTTPGVGVLDQGPLIHYEVETTALTPGPTPSDPGTCGTTWAVLAGTRRDHPTATLAGVTVPVHTCVRLRTSFGKTPQAALLTTATTAARDANRLNIQRGLIGDFGYFVASPEIKVGGPLVSEHANLRAVEKVKSDLRVVFDTDTELNVTSFDVVGIDGKGGRKVLGTVPCEQCTSGLGASYDELISGAKLQGAKKVQVVMQPSGVQSNTLDLK